jgi:hypothetical protein
VEFFRSGQEKTEQGRVRRRKTGTVEMTFTGTLIEDLMATVERAEQRAHSDGALLEPLLVGAAIGAPLLVDPWFASVQQNADYDSKLLGVT